jgi:hypothetical protein
LTSYHDDRFIHWLGEDYGFLSGTEPKFDFREKGPIQLTSKLGARRPFERSSSFGPFSEAGKDSSPDPLLYLDF